MPGLIGPVDKLSIVIVKGTIPLFALTVKIGTIGDGIGFKLGT
jgi:hypothetical protein